MKTIATLLEELTFKSLVMIIAQVNHLLGV